MRKLGTMWLAAAALAATATPARADWSWSWVNACGGDNFVTCMSGDIAYNQASKTITVHVTNLPIEVDVYTAVGLFSLPGADPTSFTSGGLGWTATNGINGGGLPGTNDQRFALGTDGIGGGFTEADGQQEFTFTFDYDLEAYSSTVGVGIHAQGGPGGCSTKAGVIGGQQQLARSGLRHDGSGAGDHVPDGHGPAGSRRGGLSPSPGAGDRDGVERGSFYTAAAAARWTSFPR